MVKLRKGQAMRRGDVAFLTTEPELFISRAGTRYAVADAVTEKSGAEVILLCFGEDVDETASGKCPQFGQLSRRRDHKH